VIERRFKTVKLSVFYVAVTHTAAVSGGLIGSSHNQGFLVACQCHTGKIRQPAGDHWGDCDKRTVCGDGVIYGTQKRQTRDVSTILDLGQVTLAVVRDLSEIR